MTAQKRQRNATAPDHVARFTSVVTTDWRRRIVIPVPFDPDAKWGEKDRHHVAGTVNGRGVRAVIERIDATKRRPDVRAERIAQMVRLLERGVKQR